MKCSYRIMHLTFFINKDIYRLFLWLSEKLALRKNVVHYKDEVGGEKEGCGMRKTVAVTGESSAARKKCCSEKENVALRKKCCIEKGFAVTLEGHRMWATLCK